MRTKQQISIVIPADLDFATLKLARDPLTGEIIFEWAPIERICAASGIDVAVFRDQHEDNVAGLIMQWYAEHISRDGARDPVQDELIAETLAEDERGGGFSHQPGRA